MRFAQAVMSLPEIQGPDLAGVVADATAAELPHVVIGGFAVIAHGYPRATRDSDLLVPDGPDADNAIGRFLELAEATRFADDKKLDRRRHPMMPITCVWTRATASSTSCAEACRHSTTRPSPRAHLTASLRGSAVRVAGLPSLVGFKRLAGRTQDRADLEALERRNGELPIEPIPGLDG